eukprot:364089-Chlamydomonas_euryale.AAC.7
MMRSSSCLLLHSPIARTRLSNSMLGPRLATPWRSSAFATPSLAIMRLTSDMALEAAAGPPRHSSSPNEGNVKGAWARS